MSLDAIPIHVVPPGEPGLTGNAPPLLRELLEMVRRLLATGEASAIDLSAFCIAADACRPGLAARQAWRR